MSFIGKAIKGIGQAIGLIPETPKLPALPPVPLMSQTDTAAAADASAARMAAAMQGGRTSTMLTGGMGEDEAKLNTSKVLLGS